MVQQVSINGDQVIVGRGGAALVASKSEPGAWHSVKAGRCDCKSFAYRGRCRHVGAVATAAGQTIPIVNPTFALAARMLAGDFGGRKQREEWNLSEVAAGEYLSFAEWSERRAS